jgi:DNA polymerase
MSLTPEAQALQWYSDAGVDVALDDKPNNRFDQIIDVSDLKNGHATPAPTKPKQKPALAKPNQDVQKQLESCTSLDDLKAAIENHNDYPFRKTATNLVMGDGNPDADIMVIGDPPTRDEDRSGKAFDGPHGVLLDKMLAAIGLSRETVYLSHIMHYPAPGNRTPTEDHLAIAKPFVEKQIEIISPKHIILMGSHALNLLSGESKSLSRTRGKWFEYGSRKIPALVTYTPEFLMQNPLQKKKAWQDLLSFQDKINA